MIHDELDQATLGAIVQALPDPVFVVDEHGRYVDVLGGRGALPERPGEALVGKSLHEVLPHDVADELLASIHAALDRNAPHVEEYCMPAHASAVEPLEGEQWFQARITPLPSAPGQPRRVAWLSTEITQRKQLEHQLEQAALTDSLTETWNERHFMRILGQEITRQGRYKEPFCLLLMELDHADTVRTQFGGDVADGCVRDVARLIRMELRHSDVLGRLDTDRFGVVLVNTPMNWSLEVGQRIAIRVSRMPFTAPGRTLHLSISGGLTDFRNGDNTAAMLKRAEQALRKSQAAGRDRVSVG
jgi:diguanylate cyclase (GGDEF)-like protein